MTASARDMTLLLLAARASAATICPSEVARAVASGDRWRDVMPTVHDAIDGLVAEGRIQLSWKGRWLARRDGPYRIGCSDRGSGAA